MPDATKRVYRGTCDASAAVSLRGTQKFVTASDEDSILRVYDRRSPGLPVEAVDVGPFLRLPDSDDEVDIEGAAQLGKQIYWIGSHGRDGDGREQQSRQRLFATALRISGDAVTLAVEGTYTKLLKDLIGAPELAGLGLGEGASRAPKDPGGLSIEGLAPTPEGDLLIGFRNPIPEAKALIVRLSNPSALVRGDADRAVITRAALLDLGGRGIRAIEFVPPSSYLIVGGAFDATRNFRLFRWSGGASDPVVTLDVPGLDDLNPEELIAIPDGDVCEIELLSDDSDRLVGDKKCKKLKDETRQSFRSLRFEVPMRVITGR
jgi:hypothetical protein